MSKHLSDEQLLNEQFMLGNSSDSKRAQEHLAECRECTRRAQELAERFTVLDELKEQPEVSEQNIADILRAVRTRKPEPRSYPLLTRVLFFATPAAVFVLLVAVFMPTQSGMPPEVREIITAKTAEQVAEPKVVSLARAMGGVGQALPARPILGKTAVMVLAKATPTFERRQWAVDKAQVARSASEVVEGEVDAQPMLAMKSVSVGRSVKKTKVSPARRESGLIAGMVADSIVQEGQLMAAMDEAEAPMELASVPAPAPDVFRQKEGLKRDYEGLAEKGKDSSVGADVPVTRIFRTERETEEWESIGEQSFVRILSKPVGDVNSNRAVTAWQVTIQNLSDKTVDVSVSRPLLNRDWSANAADEDVSIQSADENNIRFALTVGPRATKTFVYELHPALPASGGVVENAKEKESKR